MTNGRRLVILCGSQFGPVIRPVCADLPAVNKGTGTATDIDLLQKGGCLLIADLLVKSDAVHQGGKVIQYGGITGIMTSNSGTHNPPVLVFRNGTKNPYLYLPFM